MGKDKKKKKKQKITYVDDGRSLADMSGVGGRRSSGLGGPDLSHGTRKDQTRTFLNAMKMMVVPMLVTMGIITAAFGIMWLLLMAGSC